RYQSPAQLVCISTRCGTNRLNSLSLLLLPRRSVLQRYIRRNQSFHELLHFVHYPQLAGNSAVELVRTPLMGKKRAVAATTRTPVFPFPAAAGETEPPHHFSDYGFDPQLLRFSQLVSLLLISQSHVNFSVSQSLKLALLLQSLSPTRSVTSSHRHRRRLSTRGSSSRSPSPRSTSTRSTMASSAAAGGGALRPLRRSSSSSAPRPSPAPPLGLPAQPRRPPAVLLLRSPPGHSTSPMTEATTTPRGARAGRRPCVPITWPPPSSALPRSEFRMSASGTSISVAAPQEREGLLRRCLSTS
uniref:Uncharacterized protein n=2 Tax=Aegilops tauschii subsp. strangulata TaxID=200361 RepID=A0A452YY10_AEGTS